MLIETISDKIKKILELKKEGTYWDFKQSYPTDNLDLVYDIICLANNLDNKDALLVYGVQDKTYELIGVETDPNRKRQSDILDLLRNGCSFENGCYPRINVHTIQIEGCTLDAISIKHYIEYPYRLTNDFVSKSKNKEERKQKRIIKFVTYTRVGDTNSPITTGATPAEMKMLWGGGNTPKFDVRLVSSTNETLVFKHIKPKNIAQRNPLIRITNEDVEQHPELSWQNVSMGVISSNTLFGSAPPGILPEDNLTDEEIENYNKELPSKEEVDDFNEKNLLYVNLKNKDNYFVFEVENIGTSEANNISLILNLPNGLLAFDKNDIDDIEEPKPLNYPEHPVFAKLTKKITSKFNALSSQYGSLWGKANIISSATVSDLKISSNLFVPRRLYANNLHIDNRNEIRITINNILQSRYKETEKFYIVATKPGKYVIKYDLVCRELQKPQRGIVELEYKD